MAWLHRRRAVILTYHGILPSNPPPATRALHKIFVTVDEFRAQMALLRARYEVLSLRELVERLAKGDAGENIAAVTFDDGWRSTRTLAAPILRELRVPATVFIATGLMGSPYRGLWTQRLAASIGAARIGRIRLWDIDLPFETEPQRVVAMRAVASFLKGLPPDDREERLREVFARYGNGHELGAEMEFMSLDEVRELAAYGVDCGAHTVDHEILSSLPFAKAREQIRQSRAQLEDMTGLPCRLFAYPNGRARDFSDDHTRALADEGFDGAVTQIPGRNSPGTDSFRLRRINVGLEHTLHTFLTDLDGLRHW